MFKKSLRVQLFISTSLIVLIILAMYLSLTKGTYDLSVKDVVSTIFRINPNSDSDLVIFQFRLPRIIIATLVGFGLGIAGTVIQGITKNGLADPGILGINSGAAVAIVAFIFIFQGKFISGAWYSILAMPLFGLIGGILASVIIYLFSWKNGRLDMQRLILVGIAISSGFGAVSLYLSLRMNPSDFEAATVWINGSISNANWTYIAAITPWIIILVPIIIKKAYILDLFQLEEESVKSLGVSVEKEKMVLLLAAVGIVSACVSVSGNIGFIGLLAPHIAKALVGIRHKAVVIISGLVGALLVIFADFVARTIFSPTELSVGIVISIVGIPYFVYLLIKAKV